MASRLVKVGKTSNAKYVTLIGDSINGLVDLLIIEMRCKSHTCMDLLEAMVPIFTYASPFYASHHQKILEPTTSNYGSGSAVQRKIEPKADLSQFTQAEIEWRNGLAVGDEVDVVKHDLGFGVECWAKGKIFQITGTAATNLGDADGSNVKKFHVKYTRDLTTQSKTFRADDQKVQPFESYTKGDEWRANLQPYDQVDVLDSYSEWDTWTVIKNDGAAGSLNPMITVGYRRYHADGEKSDSMGRFSGKGAAYDLTLPLFTCRVQRGGSAGRLVWKHQAQAPL